MSEFEDKVLNFLEKLDKKLDSIMGALKGSAPSASSPAPSDAGGRRPSDLIEAQEQEERETERPPLEGRRVCPKCGSTDFRTEEDKSKVLYQQGGVKIYQKKYTCKNCGEETF